MLQCQYLALEFDKIKYFEEKTVDGMLEANKKDSKISSYGMRSLIMFPLK